MSPYRDKISIEIEKESKSMTDIITSVLAAILIFIISAFTVAVLAVICAIPVYFLWNWIGPDVFHLPEVTFAQAWGMSWLSALLFKNYSSNTKKED